jgi:hypothetical protein
VRVIANSLPKSGTHLIGRVLELVGIEEMHKGLTGALIRPTSRNPIKNYILNRRQNKKNGEENFSIDLDDLNNIINKKYLDQYFNAIDNGQFITAHVPYSHKLDCYLDKIGFKVIYIVRDPRDVLVSLYNFHLKNFKPYSKVLKSIPTEAGINRIYEGMETKGARLSPLPHRVRNSLGWFNSKNVLAIKFEALIGEKGGGSKELQLQTIQDILSFLSIDTANLAQEIQHKVFDTEAQTFNKGKVHQYVETLAAYQIERLEGDLKNEMKVLGY